MTARAKLALATIALIAVVLAAYSPVRKGAFVGDDHALVDMNRGFREGPLRAVFLRPFWTADPTSEVRPAYYRPLVVVSLRFDAALAQDDAPSYHFTNLVLHAVALALFVTAARRLGVQPPAAVAAAAVWALSPRLTESVAWISGRTDVLAACFVFAAIAVWPWYGARASAPATRGDHARATCAALALLAGLLAKEVAFAGVVAIAAGTLVEGGPTRRRALGRVAYAVLPLAPYAVLRWIAMARAAGGGAARATAALGAAGRAGTVLETLGRYVEMMLDPWHSASSIGLMGEVDGARASAGALVVLGGVALGVRAWRKRAAPDVAVVVGGALAVAAFLPVLHMAPIALAASVAADRLLYVPLAGVALAVASAAARLPARKRHLAGVATAVLAASFVPVTRARAEDYTSELTYRVAAAEHAHARNTGPLSSLAWVLREWGAYDLACRLHRSARATLERSGRAGTPRHTRVLENLAGCHALLGSYDQAGAIYAELLSREPAAGRVHMELGFLHLHRFDLDRAQASFERALSLEPALTPARRALADIPSLRREVTELSTDEARRGQPVAWARLLAQLGRRPDAIAAWSKITDDPASPLSATLDAARFQIKTADAAVARHALDTYAARGGKGELVEIFARRDLELRERRHARVTAMRARIEALAPE